MPFIFRYMDTFNSCYSGSHTGKTHDSNLNIIDNTHIYIVCIITCKVLFSIIDCALTRYLYKDYIKSNYNHLYMTSHLNIKNLNINDDEKPKKKNTNI